MKIPFSAIFLVLYTAWMFSAIHGAPLTATTELNVYSTEEADGWATNLGSEKDDDEESDESPFTVEDLKEELARQLEEANEIEPETRPTKKRQHANIRNSDHHRSAYPMPYYPAAAPAPMPYALTYSQCPYSQPLYYPQPMYPPYPYPPYSPISFADQQSSHNSVKAAIDSKDTTEVVNIEELLKIANLWNKRSVTTTAPNKDATTKGKKRLSIRNWIRNKKNKFTSTTEAPTTIG